MPNDNKVNKVLYSVIEFVYHSLIDIKGCNMKTIELFDQVDNLKCGIFQDEKGLFLAMTFTKSKTFKTENGARNWIKKFL